MYELMQLQFGLHSNMHAWFEARLFNDDDRPNYP